MKKSVWALPLFALSTSCSVVMASNKGGCDLETIQSMETKAELLAIGGKAEEGENVFHIPQKHGSTVRALVYSLLDLSTGFMWELAGTPIESSLSQKKFHSVKVTFTENDRIEKIELL